MFPEDCTTNCEGGTAIDFMLKKGRPKCPDTINHGKEQDDFIGSTLDMCNAKVRYLKQSSQITLEPKKTGTLT